MKVNQLYFSPTGSTEKVVKLIGAVWEEEKREVDYSLPDQSYCNESFAQDELCIIGVPSFGGRVPAVALTRLQQMKANGTPTILVATFGNRNYDDTLLELQNTVSENGFRVIAAIAAVTEHSILHQFGTGRPNAQDCQQLKTYANTIKAALADHTTLPVISVKGKKPYKVYNGVPLRPSVAKGCTKCGTCVKLCPVGAIVPENPSQTKLGACISCMRCMTVCPQHARKVGSVALFMAAREIKKSCETPKENEFFFGQPVTNNG